MFFAAVVAVVVAVVVVVAKYSINILFDI